MSPHPFTPNEARSFIQFMKMITKTNKVFLTKENGNNLMPLKIMFNVGWFFGIFPLNFDKNLTKFTFKVWSLSTLFALLRLLVLFGMFIFPIWIPDELIMNSSLLENKDNKSTFENESASAPKGMGTSTATENIYNVFPYISRNTLSLILISKIKNLKV